MYSDNYESKYGEYDREEDARQSLEDCLLYYLEIEHKAKSLLGNPAAQVLARSIAENLAKLVQEHATLDGRTHLAHILTETVAEFVVGHAMQNQAHLLQAVNRDGSNAIRETLDEACTAFEALLSAEAAR